MIPKYNQKELFGMLSHLNTLLIYEWSMVLKLVDYMDKIIILYKEWLDWDYKNKNPEYYPLDLSKIETWSTYEECVNLKFELNNNKLICNVIIWNGDILNGYRREKRFSAKLQLPNSFIKQLNNDIHYKFEHFLEEKYIEFLQQQKNDWINTVKKDFINHFNS